MLTLPGHTKRNCVAKAAVAFGADASGPVPWACHRWAEYVEIMPGTCSYVVSAALAARLGITTSDDREEGEQELHEADEVVGRVEAQTWRRWLRHGLGSTFLARVEYGGEIGFARAITRTDEQADAIEARYDAQRTARQADREALADAVARVHAAPGAGTRIRIDRVLAAVAAERPDRPPPDKMSVIRAMARGEARESDLAA